MGKHEFKRTRERVNNYINKGCHSNVGKETITMIPVKKFLQDIVSEKFNNTGETKEW